VAGLTAFGSTAPAHANGDPNWLTPPNHPAGTGRFTHNFADPSVIAVNGNYYAYGTNSGGSHLPVLRSTNLRTWSPRASYNRTTAATRSADASRFVPGRPVVEARDRDSSFDPWINDALLDTHPGARRDITNHNHLRSSYWSPGVAVIGGRYVAFSAVPRNSTDHRCIRASVASSATGPFHPVGGANDWVQCDSDSSGDAYSPNGSNDPDPFVAPDGTPHLVWKSEGNPNPPYSPTIIWTRQLNGDGTGFASGSRPRELLRTASPANWEGRVIENPSMIHAHGKYYLFYSANEWASSSYATGYAVCEGPLGPCERTVDGPLMSTGNGSVVAPGGADAFIDARGRLRLAFHHWVGGTTYGGGAYRQLRTAPIYRNTGRALRVAGFEAPAPDRVTVSYSASEYALLTSAARQVNRTPSRLQRNAVLGTASRVLARGGNRPTAPSTNGSVKLTSQFSAAQAERVDDLARHWQMSETEVIKYATVLSAYLVTARN